MSNIVNVDFRGKVRLPDRPEEMDHTHDAVSYVSGAFGDYEYSDELLNVGFTEVRFHPWEYLEDGDD